MMRLINEAIIHTLATKPNWMTGRSNEEKQAEVRRGHVEDNGWSDIGYHFIIWRDGEVTVARPLEEMGAHVKGHNEGTIGISLEGGYGGSADDAFSDNFTPAQEVALLAVLGRFDEIKITGHNQYANKACPCFNVPRWLSGKGAKPQRNTVQQTTTVKASNIAKIAAVASPVIGGISGLPWQNLLITGVFAIVILAALGYIDVERWKKFVRGDR